MLLEAAAVVHKFSAGLDVNLPRKRRSVGVVIVKDILGEVHAPFRH